ncbi:DedA family protein [Hydrogenovibrio sp. 3SP14C1]|uniref:YqaA family protein n=1 Tax=Hydrogenovibrio sp. 3SP14C1 TaxID=3038774 RepID=UPI0024173A73|nr:YqaA family protein [Hydrogenovibrio sp. 3SP14C1]MDG4812816.1 DedA family protein [Hydrogenovibrio sp. 3SP14C1]
MKIFTALYDRALLWSKHPKATWYLGGMSFTEASFFPIPPDVMLIPMSLAQPKRAYYFAWIATIMSLMGGIFGYAIGYWLLDAIWPIIESLNYVDKYNTIEGFFAEYGVWIVFLAGFSPIPYKLFTISAGATSMAFLPFLVASFIGRGARFFLVAALMKIGGERYESRIRQSVDWIGYGIIALIVAYLALKQL